MYFYIIHLLPQIDRIKHNIGIVFLLKSYTSCTTVYFLYFVSYCLITEDDGYPISNGKSAWTSGIADVSELGVHGRSVPQEYVTTNTKWLDEATLPVSAGEDGENHRTTKQSSYHNLSGWLLRFSA